MEHLDAGKYVIYSIKTKFKKNINILIIIHYYFVVCFSSFVLDRDTCSLHPTIEEYVDGARICLELESEKDSLREIKLYFCRFVMKMIKSFEREYTILIILYYSIIYDSSSSSAYGPLRANAACHTSLHRSLFSASSTRIVSSIVCRSFSTISSHLCLGLPHCLF